jgi:hypothetical protein
MFQVISPSANASEDIYTKYYAEIPAAAVAAVRNDRGERRSELCYVTGV